MAIPVPGVEFNQSDVGGQYLAKLQALAQAVDAAVGGVNSNAGLESAFAEYVSIAVPGYVGRWEELTGAVAVDDVVYHAATQKLWKAVQVIADVTASEPAGANSDWEILSSTINIATTAEALAGTAGAILDAARGHEMVAYWGIPFPRSIPNVDIDTVTTGRNYTCYGSLHPNANAGDNPFPNSGGAFSLRVTGEGLGVPGKYCLQIASELSSSKPATKVRSIAGNNWSPWTTIWTDKNLAMAGSSTDITVGSVPFVGWLGLGNPIELTSSDDLYDLPSLGINCTAYYDYTGGNSPSNTPEPGAAQVTRTFHTTVFEKLEVYRPGSGKTFVDYKVSGVWQGWQEAGSSGSGGFVTDSVRAFTSADESSNNITVDLDCSQSNFFLLDFSDGSISTSGTITLNLTNVPDGTDDVFYGHIAAVRLGRKATASITCAGKTVSWISTPSAFNNNTTGFDNIHFYTMPLNPSKLLLSLNDGRSSGYM
ncbi:pyocin knob domain-containing protein [uncultured Gilvimarinus sp.]|uniref:pyocin knob domain-containing protein n=1 Tax=uncultured Gilvimarinus sp. TaxID=1689143 RepID=UPI0030DC90C9